ncbi:MAG: biotin/lipoyl-binding protein [Gemmatales bacterium]|nr:biotin/lipoyl-binding protein [Gemmatales bacterium]MDW8388171.1 biotin/lipoyl-binding protein [Gemmatales bacterium]
MLRYTVYTAIIVAVLVVVAGLFTFDLWKEQALEAFGWTEEPAPEAPHDHHHADAVRLSPQARANLGLRIEPLRVSNYWRTLQMPGTIIDRPGESDRGVPAPVAGVVVQLFARQGDQVRPGDPLLVLRLTSEALQNSQTELLKLTKELEINKAEIARYSSPDLKAINPGRLIELEYQRRRLEAGIYAQRQDLAARGLTPEQIDQVATGQFLREMTVQAPGQPSLAEPPVYDVEELRVKLGDQVQAGDTLCILADHRLLYVEGRALAQEISLLEEVARERRPVRVEMLTGPVGTASQPNIELPIHFIANKLDAQSHSLRFYLLLPNVPLSEPVAKVASASPMAGQPSTERRVLWRYRPGQQVRLFVPVEEFRDKFVLPAGAVIREGSEAYVFRANGDLLERRSVHVLYQDRLTAVLEPETSDVSVGNYVAMNAAAALNRALKAQAEGEGHGHHHHDH